MPRLRHTAAAFSAPHCDEDTQLAIALTVTEACANVVRHAYPAGGGDLDMTAWLEGANVVFEIADGGIWLEQSPSGTLGVGLVVMRRLADVQITSNDRGTRVELRFPRRPQRTHASAAAGSPADPPGHGGRPPRVTATLDAQGNAHRLVVHKASTQVADLTRDDPHGRPIERTDMEAEPGAKNGVDGPKGTAESRAPSGSGGPDRPARAPLRTTFKRLARFSTHTRRWHSVDPASGRRGEGTGKDIPRGQR